MAVPAHVSGSNPQEEAQVASWVSAIEDGYVPRFGGYDAPNGTSKIIKDLRFVDISRMFRSITP